MSAPSHDPSSRFTAGEMRCADCGVDTLARREWYMAKNAVWEQAWPGCCKVTRVPGQEILCIGCLEVRLRRTLAADDFTDAWVNSPARFGMSKRLRDRVLRTAEGGR